METITIYMTNYVAVSNHKMSVFTAGDKTIKGVLLSWAD